jgi:hypothetical protein
MVEEDCGLSGSSLLFADDRADNIGGGPGAGLARASLRGAARAGPKRWSIMAF